MWPGPYGEWGSRKYLLASLDQSLARDGARLRRHLLLAPLRPRHAARGDDGRARHRRAARARRSTSGSPRTRPRRRARRPRSCASSARRSLIHQPSYSMLNRWIEPELLDALGELGIGCIAFSPLAQGMLTDKYLDGDPRGLAGEPAASSLVARPAHRRGAREDPRPERDRRSARPDARPDGARLGAARPARDLGAHRRQQRAAARGQRRRARNLDFTDEELARDRPPRDRQRHQLWAAEA